MAEIVRKNLISVTQLIKKIAQHGYEGNYTAEAIYRLFEKYDIRPKKTYNGFPYFNRKNACDCIERHIFELRQMAEQLEAMDKNYQSNDDEREVGYDRNDMSAVSRELLANDGVFGADENELYATKESKEPQRNKKRITITEQQFLKYFTNKKGL